MSSKLQIRAGATATAYDTSYAKTVDTARSTTGVTSSSIPASCDLFTVTTCAVRTSAVVLPAEEAKLTGKVITVHNDGCATSLTIYPASSAESTYVTGGAQDAAIATAAGSIKCSGGTVSGGAGYILDVNQKVKLLCLDGLNWSVLEEPGVKVELLVAGQILTAAGFTVSPSENGKTFMIPAPGGAATITLPAPGAGLQYEFVLAATAGSTVALTSSGANILGKPLMIASADATTVDSAWTSLDISGGASTTIQFAATALQGSFVRVKGTGASWVAEAVARPAASFTIA